MLLHPRLTGIEGIPSTLCSRGYLKHAMRMVQLFQKWENLPPVIRILESMLITTETTQVTKLQRTLLMIEKSQLHQRPERIAAGIRKGFKTEERSY